jgi:O-antigen/teichoic acid export membrane protein
MRRRRGPRNHDHYLGAVANDTQQNVALTFGANLVLAAMNAVTGIVLARLLLPAGRGELQAVQTWGFVLGTVAVLGVDQSVVYYVSRRRDDAGSIMVTSMVVVLAASLVFTAVAWLAVPTLLQEQSDATKDLARLFSLIIPVYALSVLPMQALRAVNAFAHWNVLRVLASGMWLVLVIGAWATGHLSVAVLAWGFFATQVIFFVVASAIGMRAARGPFRIRPAMFGSLLRFGLPSVMGTVPQLLNLRLDQMLLVAFVAPQQLGLYVAAVAWTSVLYPALSSLGPVLFPRIASETEPAERFRLMAKGFRSVIVVTTAVVAIVLVITPVGVRLLFGAAFDGAIPAALILVTAGGVLAVAGVLQDGFRGLGRPAEVLWSELIGLGATGLMLAVLLPPLGIVGAALASMVGYTTTVVVLLVRLRRAAGDEPLALRPRAQDLVEVGRAVRTVARRGVARLRRRGGTDDDDGGQPPSEEPEAVRPTSSG